MIGLATSTELINTVAEHPSQVKDIVIIAGGVVFIIGILVLFAKGFIKSENESLNIKIEGIKSEIKTLKEGFREEIVMLRDSDIQQKNELSKIYDLLISLKTELPNMLNDIKNNIVNKETVNTIVDLAMAKHKDTCLIRTKSSKDN